MNRNFSNGATIFLTGMPGSGKSSMGSKAAILCGYEYLDVDSKIEEICGKSVNQIFDLYGESFFREMETNVIKDLPCVGWHLVSTGGGLITFDKNYEIMKKRGLIVFLNRDLQDIWDHIDIYKRPLLRDGGFDKFKELFIQRIDIYKKRSDKVITGRWDEVEEGLLKYCKSIKQGGTYEGSTV